MRVRPIPPCSDTDLAARCVRDGVAQQVREDLGHPLAVARKCKVFRRLQHEGMPLRAQGCDLDLGAGDLDEIALAQLQGEAARGLLPVVEQVLYQTYHPARLRDDDGRRALPFRARHVWTREPLRVAAQRCQRRGQVVRDHRHQLVAPRAGCLQFGASPLERGTR